MKMTKRIAVMAVCAAMAATSMISVCVSASEVTVNEKYLISEMGQSASGIVPYADAVSLNVSKFEDKYRQGNGNWCWVACTQFVLKYLGKYCSQAEIYKSAKNTDTVEDKRGTLDECKTAINNLEGSTFYSGNTATYKLVSGRIDNKNIVIIRGFRDGNSIGHTLVCYGYKETTNSSGNTNYVLMIYDLDSNIGGYGTLTSTGEKSTSFTLKVGNNTSSFKTDNYIYGK